MKTHRSGTSDETPPMSTQDCTNCGRPHETRHRESYPALGKACRKCGKRNHFAVKCRSKRTSSRAYTVNRSQGQKDYEDDGETLTLQLPVHCLDDSQFVTLHMKTGSFICFQVDTGAQCNVLPLGTYKEATGDLSPQEYHLNQHCARGHDLWGSCTTHRRKSCPAGLARKNKVPPRMQVG